MDGLIKLGFNMAIETKWQMQEVSTTVVRGDEGISKNHKKKSSKILRLTSIAVPRVSPRSEREEAIASKPFCNVGPSVPFLGELSVLCFTFEDCTIQKPLLSTNQMGFKI